MTILATEKRASQTFASVKAQHAGPCGDGQSFTPTHEEIARSAYDIYVKSGRVKGHCTRNWQQAEQALRDQGQAVRQTEQCCSGAIAPHSAGAR